MPQPVKYDVESMLDAVRRLVLSGGPAAATARAVSEVTGAPSGSIYHRFPGRDDLVAAAWVRALDRFLTGFLPKLAPGTARAGADAAAHVVAWSAANVDDAAMLARFSLRDLLRKDVSPEIAARAEALQAPLQPALRQLAKTTGATLEDVVIAVVDIPNGIVRRLLAADQRPRPRHVDATRRAARLLLQGQRIGTPETGCGG